MAAFANRLISDNFILIDRGPGPTTVVGESCVRYDARVSSSRSNLRLPRSVISDREAIINEIS
jgi:hypothetical protein